MARRAQSSGLEAETKRVEGRAHSWRERDLCPSAKIEVKTWMKAGGYSAEELLRKPPLEFLVPLVD